jgi:hypothetical protein
VALPCISCALSILVGGATHRVVGTGSPWFFSKRDAARKWPMFVMHEPRNTSSIGVPATSLSVLMSSGSFGQASRGSLMVARSISNTL